MKTETKLLQQLWKRIERRAKVALQKIQKLEVERVEDKDRKDTLLEVITDCNKMQRKLRGEQHA